MQVSINQPFAFILNPKDDVIFSHLILRVADGANLEDTRQQANGILQKFYAERVLNPYDNCVAKSYDTELRFFRQMFIIGFVCIAITLVGLFCLTMFETEYRRKEIGIRKVAGATTSEIVWMLCRRYGLIILLCFALAAPIAWYFGVETLTIFKDRTAIHWWIFPLSLLLVGGIMLGTVALQSWLAARKNPASTIKTE
jgi:putative ABC transport system permease protein